MLNFINFCNKTDARKEQNTIILFKKQYFELILHFENFLNFLTFKYV